MQRLLILVLALVSVAAMISASDADARRMGGGRSFGAQRSITPSPAPAPSVTSPGAASNPVMPAPSTATPARPAAPPVAPAAGGASRWLGPIAGIAAGLGLAALFSHFGLSESFGSFFLILLIVVGGLWLVRALFARRVAAPGYAAGSGGPARNAPFETLRVEPTAPRADASAPRFEPTAPRADASAPRFEPAWGGGTSATGTGARTFPPGFEPAPFVAEAKRQFMRLQDAYDRADRSQLADVLTPAMLADISRELAERGPHVPTEVVALDGEVLNVATENGEHWASVRFTGQTREDGRAAAEPFDEVWNLVKPVDGSTGWRLAGIQQYA